MEDGPQRILPPDWLPEYPDPRAEVFPLMGSCWPSVLTALAYFIIVWAWVKIAKYYKEKEKVTTSNGHNKEIKAADSKTTQGVGGIKLVMFLYNAVMVLYNAVIVLEILVLMYKAGYGLGCQAFDPSFDDVPTRFVRVGYMFFISKFFELIDTFFFLWRGKLDQVSFLHVFHHGAMPPSIYWGVKYASGGLVFMFPLANSFVHVIMYSYYALSAVGAHRYLWWKKYLTELQMIQFLIFIVHQGQIFTINRDCNYPKIFPLVIIIYASIFFVLFANFYVQAYWRRRRLAKSVHQSGKTLKESGRENGTSLNGRSITSNGDTMTRLRKTAV